MAKSEKQRIIEALKKGRMIYETGKKIKGYKTYESLNPETRKNFGLEPLEKIVPNWQQYLPLRKA